MIDIMIQTALFVIISAGIVYVSRASLRMPRSHGFYRFFAWEAILALVLLNLGTWFRDPWTVHQLISWLLLLASLILIIEGVRCLRVIGQPDPNREEDVPAIGIEKTTTLVTVGVYKYIRHPLYSSLLFLGWGAFFKDPSWFGGFLAVAATLALVATAKVEEAENVRVFGAAYATYMQHNKRFVPFLF